MPNDGEHPHLRPEVTAFLERLDDDDVVLLERAIDLTRLIASAGQVAKWLIIGAAGLIVGGAALGDAVMKIGHWMSGR